MLLLAFQLGNDRYAIEVTHVIEVLPLVDVKQLPRAPAGMAGMFDYHGEAVPLIDLAALVLGVPSRKWMSTRIIVVRDSREPVTVVLGLLAEQVTETIRRSEEDFKNARVSISDAPYLGPVTTYAGSIVQRIEVQNLFSGIVRGLLFGERIGSA
jgi:chemotaxis-related protein WspB